MKRPALLLILLSLLCAPWLAAAESSKGKGDYVVILHGIARSSTHMEPLAEYLARAGYDVLNLDYPSTDYPLETLVELLHEQLPARLMEDKPVHFVGYSMGGLLARAYLHTYRPRGLGRVVQLASPNHGSEVADFLEDNWLYGRVFGPAGKQLVTHEAGIGKLLGSVDYELGVIAGNSTIDPVSSLIIPGDDDGKVSIASTNLKGMKDHIVVAASHTFFPDNEDAQRQTLYFLQHGTFNHSPKEDAPCAIPFIC